MTSPLLAAVDEVLNACPVNAWGHVQKPRCKRADVVANLDKQEQSLGRQKALRVYCHALGQKRGARQALIAYRIGRVSSHLHIEKAADPETFTCLIDRLRTCRESAVVRHIAGAVATMGPALKRAKLAVNAIQEHPDDNARRAGYQALWAGGRLATFPYLRDAIADTSLEKETRIAAIRGFAEGRPMDATERTKVCPVLTGQLDAADAQIVGSATLQIVNTCPEHTEAVIETAQRLTAQHAMDHATVAALTALCRNKKTPPSAARLKRIRKLLALTVNDQTALDRSRSAALVALSGLDPKRARRLARRWKNTTQPLLRHTVLRVFESR